MPREIDWGGVDKPKGSPPVPTGHYLGEIAEIKTKTSQDGDEYWVIYWEVVEPAEFAGRRIRDALFFHTKNSLPRCKLLWECIALNVNGLRGMPDPDDLVGRRAWLEVYLVTKKIRGENREVNNLPFNSYGPVDQEPLDVSSPPPHTDDDRPGDDPGAVTDDDIPF